MTDPTHVFGFGAREWRDANAPAAVVIEGSTLNPTIGANGSTPEKRRDILVMPGGYTGVSGYLGKRAYIRVRGLTGGRKPAFRGGAIQADYATDVEVTDLELENCPIGISHSAGPGGSFRVYDNYLHSWTTERNGISNPNNRTVSGWVNEIKRNIFDAVGGKGNTTHTMYMEGRPGTVLIVEENEFRGSRMCSMVKSTCNDNQIRRNIFRTHSQVTTWTAHTMIDFPACSRGVIHENVFECWGDQTKPDGQQGLHTPPIFIRLRQNLNGSDEPPYDSPEYWNPAHWDAIRNGGLDNFENPLLFQIFVHANTFKQLNAAKVMSAVRNDGTHGCEVAYQFGPNRLFPVPANWVDPSAVFMGVNTYEGVWAPPQLRTSQYTVEVMEGAAPYAAIQAYLATLSQRERDNFNYTRWPEFCEPHQRPRCVDVPLTVPAGFRT